MVSTAAEILDKKVVLNEYLELFQVDSEPEKDKVLEDINAFIALVRPDINAGIITDIEAAALKAGVDIATARSVVESVLESLDRLPGPGRKAPGKPTPGRPVAPGKNLPAQSVEVGRLLTRDGSRRGVSCSGFLQG